MMRIASRFLALAFAIGIVSGCGSSSAPDTKSAPITVKEGADKKGNKTKMMEAAFEDPPKK